MSTRRTKNVDYDDDDLWEAGGGDDWSGGWGESGASWSAGGWDWDEGWAAPTKPKAKPAAAKPKAATRKAAAAKASGAKSAAAPKASASAQQAATAKTAAVDKAKQEKPSPTEGSTASSTAPSKSVAAKASPSKSEAAGTDSAKAPKAKVETSTASAADAKATEEDSGKAEDLSTSVPATSSDDARPNISLVVVGHVDAGKSTLMGHLLCLVGEVSSKTLHKFEKESKQLGKASFAYAWVLDEGDDERQRGVTIDVCVKHFATKARRFTILDAPGHRDFVPNMLQGAVQADVALLVADTSHFEAGFERGGQTKEHIQLVRALGISHVVVAINKLDTCDWSQQKYETIKGHLELFMTGSEVGYKSSQISWVPLSGFTGENMLERKDPALSWWEGHTLIEALDALPIPSRPSSDLPLRLPVSDLYKSGANVCVSGKVEAGKLTAGQKVLVLPSGETATVKSIQSRGEGVRVGHPGQYMDSVVLPLEPQFVTIGGTLSDPTRPPPVTDAFQAQILVFDIDIPLMRGQQLMCYLHTETLTATLSRLEKLIVKGKPQEKRPKCLQKGNIAIVNLRVDHKVCVDPKPKDGSPPTSLARLVLRDRGQTIAAGVVVDVLTT